MEMFLEMAKQDPAYLPAEGRRQKRQLRSSLGCGKV